MTGVQTCALPILIEAVDTLTTEKAVKLYEKFGIFTKAELESRKEVLYETYIKTINIEALTMIEMASKQIVPAVIRYSKSLADTVLAVKAAGVDASVQTQLLGEVSRKLSAMKRALSGLEEAVSRAGEIGDVREKAFFYKDVVKEAMTGLRKPADELEMLVDKKVWPIPTYGDLIFEV